jgi:hypothetical protein
VFTIFKIVFLFSFGIYLKFSTLLNVYFLLGEGGLCALVNFIKLCWLDCSCWWGYICLELPDYDNEKPGLLLKYEPLDLKTVYAKQGNA